MVVEPLLLGELLEPAPAAPPAPEDEDPLGLLELPEADGLLDDAPGVLELLLAAPPAEPEELSEEPDADGVELLDGVLDEEAPPDELELPPAAPDELAPPELLGELEPDALGVVDPPEVAPPPWSLALLQPATMTVRKLAARMIFEAFMTDFIILSFPLGLINRAIP